MERLEWFGGVEGIWKVAMAECWWCWERFGVYWECWGYFGGVGRFEVQFGVFGGGNWWFWGYRGRLKGGDDGILGVLGSFGVYLGALRGVGCFGGVGGVWKVVSGVFWGYFMGCWGSLGVIGAFWNITIHGNEVFLRVTNHTGQAEKNLLGPAGPSRFFSACPVWFVTRRNTSLPFSTRVHYPIIIKS